MTIRAAVLSLCLLLATACGGQDSTPASGAADTRGASVDIELVVEGTTLRGALDDSAAGRDFAALLPLTVIVTDFHATEKIGDLPRRLSTEDAPAGTTPSPGDITYYAPWGNLALFYRDFAYSAGLVRLGRLDPAAVDVLAGLDDGTTVTIDTAG